jgi:hypothetical protein
MNMEMVYVITLKTGKFREEFETYVVKACKSRDEAERLVGKALYEYNSAFARIHRPPWHTRLDSFEMADYDGKMANAEFSVVEIYMEMFPSLRKHRDIFSLDGEVGFEVEEVELV